MTADALPDVLAIGGVLLCIAGEIVAGIGGRSVARGLLDDITVAIVDVGGADVLSECGGHQCEAENQSLAEVFQNDFLMCRVSVKMGHGTGGKFASLYRVRCHYFRQSDDLLKKPFILRFSLAHAIQRGIFTAQRHRLPATRGSAEYLGKVDAINVTFRNRSGLGLLLRRQCRPFR